MTGWLTARHVRWVGGRTSITSAVGFIPGVLIGSDIREFLAGAAQMDAVTRVDDFDSNPAALLLQLGIPPVAARANGTWLCCLIATA